MMRSTLSLLAVVFCILVVALTTNVEAKSTAGDKILVLLDDLAQKNTYSRFWQSLTDRDYTLVFRGADDDNIPLLYFGEHSVNHIIHFAPKTESLGTHKFVNNIAIVKFVNEGGNLLMAADPAVSSSARSLASEFGIEIDNDRVFDHNALDKSHSVFTTSNVVAPGSIVGAVKAPIVYSGVSLFAGRVPLLSRVLGAEPSSFVASSYSANTKSNGQTVELVNTMQARNSARITVTGSVDLFSDAFFDKSVPGFDKSGNEEFVTELAKWTFQEKSVLKVIDHRHHKKESLNQPDWYRIKDDMIYTLEIAEFNGQDWVPFKADDIQLEIIMLDPYIRTTMKQAAAPGKPFGRFEAHVQLPDVYGVFTFRVNYKRQGLTYLVAEDVVAIRPFRHNEYPRFLSAAYPYYTAVGSMIAGFLVFSAVWLSTWKSHSKQKTQ